jgi:hypothetical protein
MKSRMLVPLVVAIALVGCGKDGENKSKDAGKTVGESITNFTAGVGEGIDKSLQTDVELTQAVADRGLTKTVAKSKALDGGGKGFSVYLVSKTAFTGKLMAKALNKEGLEIGRSTVDVEFGADDAKYVGFSFPRETDTALATKYVVDVKQ